MTLSPGSRLGPYEIVGPLGAGGMGEVYRARDTRLERTVAIKILPAHLSGNAAAKERFEREARAISSLSHPNICQLYDVGSQDGIGFLVMEFLEGETLADRLTRGPLPLDRALKHGIEICEGLEQAHRAGVVHRDLKPGNIILSPTGAKLMDFGLAKAPTVSVDPELSSLKTIPKPLTTEGTIVGTFQYMSPEQVEGKELDGRSDLFALGAVLYEMVTGKRAFEGKSALSLASAILEKEPHPVGAVKPTTPPALEHAIQTCLAKDREKRWQSCRDLALQLEWIAGGGAPGEPGAGKMEGRKGRERLLAAALAVTVGVALALGALYARRPAPEARITRSYIKPMANSVLTLTNGAGFSLSPDGRHLAYVASTAEGESALWIRDLDSLTARPLPGTEGATYPFWSPDSRFVGFFAGAKLKKIELAGGPPIILGDAFEGRGGAWNSAGDIVFAPSVNSPLFHVSAGGGPVTQITTLDAEKNQLSHRWPSFLPDGRHFLYMAGSVFTSRENPTNTIFIGSLDSKEAEFLLHSHAGATYASGRILFMRLDTLMAQPFDLTARKLTGEAVPIADPVEEASLFSRGLFSASDNGILTYVEASKVEDRQLMWFDRSGKQIGAVTGEDAYSSPRISPDGKRLVFGLDSSGYHIWSYDFARNVKTALTFGTTTNQGNIFPIWSPDGRRIAYSSTRDGKQALYLKASDGSSDEEVVVEGGNQYKFPTDWSPDGRFVAYQEGYQGGWAIWILPLDGDHKPYRFLKSQFSDREAAFSPDGKWLAYCSNESGQYQVYVVPFPGPGGKWQVSPGGGVCPRWRRDGRELYYVTPENKLMAAEVSATGTSFDIGRIQPLFELRAYGVFGRYDVSADGQRFIVPYQAGQPSTIITLVENWSAAPRS